MTELEQNAYLLHSRPYRDNQSIVELITEHEGKVSALVYIGKSAKSNKKALLQPFSPLSIVLKGKSSLKNLSRVESASKSITLSGNYLYSGFYINELLVRLLPELIPCPDLFQSYQALIIELSHSTSLEPLLRSFETLILEELGVAFDYQQAMQLDGEYVEFSPELGFIEAQFVSPKKASQLYLKSDLQVIANGGVIDAQGVIVHTQALMTWKRLMRQQINHLLGNKPLNSRKLFESMR